MNHLPEHPLLGVLLRLEALRPPLISRAALPTILASVADEWLRLLGVTYVAIIVEPAAFNPPFELTVTAGGAAEATPHAGTTLVLQWATAQLGSVQIVPTPAPMDTTLLPLLLRSLSETLAELQAVEALVAATHDQARQWLGGELHDAVKQVLPAIRLLAERARNDLEHAPQQAALRLDMIREAAQQGLDELAFLLGGMRGQPSSGELRAAILRLIGQAQRTFPELIIQSRLVLPELPWNLAACVLGVVRNGLANALHHAQARIIELQLEPLAGGIVLLVRDDGIGATLDQALAAPGIGLELVSERVAAAHGTIKLTAVPDGGTCLEVWLPLVDEG